MRLWRRCFIKGCFSCFRLQDKVRGRRIFFWQLTKKSATLSVWFPIKSNRRHLFVVIFLSALFWIFLDLHNKQIALCAFASPPTFAWPTPFGRSRKMTEWDEGDFSEKVVLEKLLGMHVRPASQASHLWFVEGGCYEGVLKILVFWRCFHWISGQVFKMIKERWFIYSDPSKGLKDC